VQSKLTAWRTLSAVLAPVCDAAAFCALLGVASLRTAHAEAFAIGFLMTWLGRLADLRAAPGRLLSIGVLTLLLRGGLIGLLVQQSHWPPFLAILVVIAMGLAFSVPASRFALSQRVGEQHLRLFAFGLLAYTVLLRLVFAASVEMLPEETYYWSYAQHLDFGYLDHPPMVAWLIRAGTFLFGQSEFGVRLGALACGAITVLYVFKLTRNVFGDSAALASVALTATLPFFFLSGLLLTPDAPLTACWAAALYYFERALIAAEARAWWRVGLALGLGLFSKYSIALLGLAALAFMLWDVPSRRWFSRPQPYLAAVIAAAIFSPVVIWNAQHDWASFAFQTSRRLAEPPQFALHKLLGSMLVLVTPMGLLAIVVTRRLGLERRQARLLSLALLVPLSVFGIFSLRHEVKLDWTGPSWLAALPALACSALGMASINVPWRNWLRAAWPATAVVLAVVYAGLLHYLVLGLPGVAYSKHIETTPVGWPDLSNRMLAVADQEHDVHGSIPLIVGMDRYAIASEIAFYGWQRGGAAVETSNSVLFGGIGLMYERWTPPQAQVGRDLLLVAFSAGEISDAQVQSHVERLSPIQEEVLQRDGRFVRHYYHRMAYNYRYVVSEK
jgi:dolichol-phosphate mannosyltransferase